MTSRILKVAVMLALLPALAAGCGRSSHEGSPGSGRPSEGGVGSYSSSRSGEEMRLDVPDPGPGRSSPAGEDGARVGVSPLENQAAAGTPSKEAAPSMSPDKSESAKEEPAAPIAGKVAYLTFDDGPSAQTERILSVLRKMGVKATFFVNGDNTDRAKDLYRQIAEDGHRFGNHTYSHDYRKVYASADAFMADVKRLEKLLVETVGQKPDILRFPGGSNIRAGRRTGQAWIMPQLVKRVRTEGYQYFDWNVSSTDAAKAVQSKPVIVSSVLTHAKGKDKIIVLMHDEDVKKTTVEALPEVIRGLKRMGFRFETLNKQAFTVQFLK